MSPSKAPGKDGMTVHFFQNFWDVVGVSVSHACLSFLNSGNGIGTVNETLIAVIPKIKSSQRVFDYRPTSLCNVIYMIVSKAMVNRFRLVLNDVISESQSAFIPGRLITDNAILGFECMYALKRNKTGSTGSLALKSDMSKAYDKVE
ncbi:hypothetical protein ACOSP7_027436 [Xanthoceras sorbifolium]